MDRKGRMGWLLLVIMDNSLIPCEAPVRNSMSWLGHPKPPDCAWSDGLGGTLSPRKSPSKNRPSFSSNGASLVLSRKSLCIRRYNWILRVEWDNLQCHELAGPMLNPKPKIDIFTSYGFSMFLGPPSTHRDGVLPHKLNMFTYFYHFWVYFQGPGSLKIYSKQNPSSNQSNWMGPAVG